MYTAFKGLSLFVLLCLSACAITDDSGSCRVECEDCKNLSVKCDEVRAKKEPSRP